jgi:hypothetical protein
MKPGWLLILLLLPAIVLCKDEDMTLSIKQVKAKHENRLLEFPGVVSVGLGKDKGGNPAIIVGVDRPRSALAEQLPRQLDGYPVIVQVVGSIKAQ